MTELKEMKIDIDFIKWMCEKAEGFECVIFHGEECISFERNRFIFKQNIKSIERTIIYPLLLQRSFRFCIVNELSYMNYDELIRILGSDEEIEKYLRYVYEQEKK